MENGHSLKWSFFINLVHRLSLGYNGKAIDPAKLETCSLKHSARDVITFEEKYNLIKIDPALRPLLWQPFMRYSGARKFVNPLKCSVYRHKFDLKCDHIFIYVLKRNKVDPVQQIHKRKF